MFKYFEYLKKRIVINLAVFVKAFNHSEQDKDTIFQWLFLGHYPQNPWNLWGFWG